MRSREEYVTRGGDEELMFRMDLTDKGETDVSIDGQVTTLDETLLEITVLV